METERRSSGIPSMVRTTPRRAFYCLLLLVCSAMAAQGMTLIPLTGGHKGDQQKQIEHLEQQWRSAVLAGDEATMTTLLADSYIGIGPDGTIFSKTDEVQARISGRDHLEKLKVEDQKVRIYGTTAVVTSKVRIQGIYSGQPLLGEYRYTRVWSHTGGQWNIVSFEANRVHDSSARSH